MAVRLYTVPCFGERFYCWVQNRYKGGHPWIIKRYRLRSSRQPNPKFFFSYSSPPIFLFISVFGGVKKKKLEGFIWGQPNLKSTRHPTERVHLKSSADLSQEKVFYGCPLHTFKNDNLRSTPFRLQEIPLNPIKFCN